MTEYILPVAIKFIGFYLMTIKDTTIGCLDLQVIKTRAHPTSCKHSHIKEYWTIQRSVAPPPFTSRLQSIFIAISTIVLLAVQNK